MAGTITHQWNGSVLTITSDSGTSSSDLKGAKGDDGPRGAQGAPGSSVAEDSQKLGGVAAAQYALKNNVPAHNLLDNSDFTNPVNQRGRSGTYEGVSNYTTFVIDRWKTWSTGCTYTLSSAGLRIANLNVSSFAGPWEALPNPERMKGKTYTLAVGYNGGNVACGNVAVPTGTLTEDKYLSAVSASGTRPGLRFVIPSNYSRIEFQILIPAGQTITVEWAALYEGSYDASTLPAYQPKGYAAELAECQRYYWRYWQNNNFDIGHGYMNTTDTANITFDFPTKMRIAPTITIGDISTLRVMCVNGLKGATAYSVVKTTDKQMMVGFTLDSTSTAFTPCVMRSNSGTTIEFSADL